MDKFKIVVKTLAGLESVLADELKDLGASNIEIGRRAVICEGDKRMLYLANFSLRTALSVLKPIAEFKIKDRDELYDNISKIEWEDYLDLDKTFAISTSLMTDMFLNSMYPSLKAKDAIVDYFRDKYNKRPSIDTENPDVKINLHITDELVTVSLDSSGESLYKRGYRVGQTDAPINEVLAAGMILLSGWKKDCTFIDPMCGSGTIIIEAALMAFGIPPGIYRKEFGFERWSDFDSEMLDEIYNADYETEFEDTIIGSDISKAALKVAENNIKSAGLSKRITLVNRDISDLNKPREKGILLFNPPYGERLMPNAVTALYSQIGQRLKREFIGWDAWLISSSEDGLKNIGLRPSKKIPLINSTLECSFNQYQMFEGSNKEFKSRGEHRFTDSDRGFDKPYRRDSDRRPDDRGERKSYNGGDRRSDDRGERRPYNGGDRRSDDRGERRPYNGGDRRSDDRGERRPYNGGGDRRSNDRGERRPYNGGDRRSDDRGERRPYNGGGDRRSNDRGERRPYNGGGDRRSSDRGERRPYNGGGDRRSNDRGERRPYNGGEDRRSNDRNDRPKREFDNRRPFNDSSDN